MIKDKSIERERFDSRALSLLGKDLFDTQNFGSEAIPLPLRSPYLFYEEKIKELIKPDLNVLEIGSGTGLHTYSLIKTGANVCATDISPNALKVLEKNFLTVDGGGGSLNTRVADMEQLPFENGLFDVVTIAGSLSYGDAKKVDNEIRRVIKTGGYFICVDSLNNNPVYRLNRFIHYLKKERTKITLLNMPTIQRIISLRSRYKDINVNYFGCISYLMPLIKLIISNEKAKKTSDFIDKLLQVKKYKKLLHLFTLPISFFLYHFLHGLGVLGGLLRLATGTSPVQKIKEPWDGYGSFRIKIDEIIKHTVGY